MQRKLRTKTATGRQTQRSSFREYYLWLSWLHDILKLGQGILRAVTSDKFPISFHGGYFVGHVILMSFCDVNLDRSRFQVFSLKSLLKNWADSLLLSLVYFEFR
jgi:hypothetical protein